MITRTDFPDQPNPDREQLTEIVSNTGEFELNIDDQVFADIIDIKFVETNAYNKTTLHLDERRKLNEDMWLGKHIEVKKLYDWQVEYRDNLIWQDLETRISLASSRMPDIVVTPTGKGDLKKEAAIQLKNVLTIKVRNDVTKRLIKHGLRNLALYLQAAIKCRWDKNKGENGDFLFELTKSQRILVDCHSTIPEDGFTADNMEWIIETLEEAVSVVLSKFPTKRDALFSELGIVKGTPRQMASRIKYQEVWFTWFDSSGDIYEGVGWKYNKLVLGKMKNPYYDWEGYEQALTEPKEVDGKKVRVEKLYHNHFDRPRKPYIFLTHQNLGRNSVDDTSPVEQSIPLQKIVNKRGKQITEISDRAIPKLAFAGKYITREGAKDVTNDPNESVWLQNADDINKALMFIPAQLPSPMLYTDLQGNRMQIDSKFATHATTRGETQPSESGVSKQITREGDLTIADDVVNIVVERVMYEMANWATQMMKVMYDKPHYIKDLGRDGDYLEIEMTRDRIDDGIAVNVKASSTDKQERKNNALILAARKAIDPLSLMEDLDVPNPKERAKRLLAFSSQDYGMYAKIAGIEMPKPGMSGKTPDESKDQAILDIQRIQSGEVFDPTFIDEAYLKVLLEYKQSQSFQDLDEETKQIFLDYIQKLKQLVPPEAPPAVPPVVPPSPTPTGGAPTEAPPTPPMV